MKKQVHLNVCVRSGSYGSECKNGGFFYTRFLHEVTCVDCLEIERKRMIVPAFLRYKHPRSHILSNKPFNVGILYGGNSMTKCDVSPFNTNFLRR